MANIPTITLKNAENAEIPLLGLGCWGGMTKEERAKSKDWILSALKSGYRLLDTAYGYGTEQYVGEAVRESGIPREKIFITTKLPTHHHRIVQESFDRSLKNLGMDYVDLYLMHFPQATILNDDDYDLTDANGNQLEMDEGITFQDTWAQMEEVLASGRARAIGVSNFSIKTLTALLETAKIVPAVNEVEMHPLLAQEDLKAWQDARGIATCAYTPTGYATVRENPTVLDLAKKYGVEGAQVILAWHVKRGVIAIPKSSNVTRQRQNIDLPTLSDEDFARITALDQNKRLCNFIRPDGKCYGWTAEQYGW